jgi:recombinational DNA repair ATPase RecF
MKLRESEARPPYRKCSRLLFGPHLDDIGFFLNGFNAKSHASPPNSKYQK